MKKNTQKTKTQKGDTPLKFYTLEEVLARSAASSKTFMPAYEKELSRLRLARDIRQARLAKKLTQKQVAEKTGMPQSAIARMENGTHSVSVDTLARVARVFGKQVQLV